MKKVLLVLICLFINTNVFAYYSSDPEYNGGYVMPDLYNTGPITPKSKLVDFGEKYPEVRTDATRYLIDAKSAAKYNYTFEGFKSGKQIIVNGVSNVTVRDFLIDMGDIDHYALRVADFNNVESPTNVLFSDGEVIGSKGAAVVGNGYIARRLYIHDYYGDAFKAGNNIVIESCYIGSGGMKEGAHSDGFQVSFFAENFKLLGNRFDMIAAGGAYKANATLFLSLEKETANNATFNYNWLNGGGYTIYVCEYEEGKFTNVSFKNNIFGNGRRFGYSTGEMRSRVTGLDTSIYAEDEDVPFIGSVVYYNQNGTRITDLKNTDGKIKILANTANYTPNEQNITLVAKLYNYKNELVKTYEKDNTIMRNMTGKEYLKSNGEVIKEVTLDDFPQNVPTTLEITDLPTNLDGYYIKVEVYKKGISDKTLRTSKITNSKKKEIKLIDLSIQAKKTTFEVGEVLEKENFIVKALYSDDTFKLVQDYTVSGLGKLKAGDKNINISYSDNGITVNKNIKIKVNNKYIEPEQNQSTVEQPSQTLLPEDNESIKNDLPENNQNTENNLPDFSEIQKPIPSDKPIISENDQPEKNGSETNDSKDESIHPEDNNQSSEIIESTDNKNEDINDYNDQKTEIQKPIIKKEETLFNPRNGKIAIAGLCIISSSVTIWYKKRR